jgi:hypothetical protein
MDDPSMLVSDAEREEAVIALREHLVAGRLTLDEFSARIEAALRAGVRRELAQAQQGLPSASAALAGRKPTRLTAALFSHVARRGRLRLGRWTCGATVFGDLDFDLRDAVMEQPRASVTLLLACGNVDVYVPEGVNVDIGGTAVFGHRRDWGHDAGRPDAPAIHVRVLGLAGTIDVWRVPHEMRGSGYSDIFRELEGRRGQLPS